MSSINSEKIGLQIRTKPDSEEIRLYSRRLSREFPIVDSSFEDYYRERSVGVPFLWESQPGTPKMKTREFPLPPLTPPPSFHSSPISRNSLKKQPRKNLVTSRVFLPKLNLKQTQFEHSIISSSSSSSSSSSPWSATSSPFNELYQRRFSSPPRKSFDSRIKEDESCESPVSTLCFRGGRRIGERSRGCSSSIRRLLFGDLS